MYRKFQRIITNFVEKEMKRDLDKFMNSKVLKICIYALYIHNELSRFKYIGISTVFHAICISSSFTESVKL